MTPQEFMDGAEAEGLGDAWGEPLWRFKNGDVSVEAHGATEELARAAALEALPEILALQGPAA